MMYSKLRTEKLRKIVYTSSLIGGTIGSIIGGISCSYSLGKYTLNRIRTNKTDFTDIMFDTSYIASGYIVGLVGGAVFGGICGVVWPFILIATHARHKKQIKDYEKWLSS